MGAGDRRDHWCGDRRVAPAAGRRDLNVRGLAGLQRALRVRDRLELVLVNSRGCMVPLSLLWREVCRRELPSSLI